MKNYTKLITHAGMKQPEVEAYKTLRTNLQFSSLDKQLKTLLCTSSHMSEGKTTTVCNLSISLAQNHKKVLLVDCDLRRPAVHRAFNLINEKGLTNILAEGLALHEVSITTEVPGLDIITSGPKPPNPPELLGSLRMKQFLDAASEQYDMIILDTPPVLPVTDAAILSHWTDGVILVISHGKTTIQEAMYAKEALTKVNARIIGTVLNKIPTRSLSYYGYSYGEEKDSNRTKRFNRRKRMSLLGIKI